MYKPTVYKPTAATSTAAKSLQSCLTLCDPIDGSPPGPSIHGIFQARVLEWVTIAFSYQKQILKRGVKNAGELYKKDLNDPDNYDDVITDLEPDILECEVKWALERSLGTKLVEVMEFQLSYFKS